MSGTTPKWLGDKLGLLALEGGLVARCIYPYSEERILENPWPRADTEFEEIGQLIAEDLSHIATLEGEFTFEGGDGGVARLMYDTWYRDKEELFAQLPETLQWKKAWISRFPKIDDPRTASYYDRKHIHLLKVAMALSLSYKDELVLTVEDLLRALTLLDMTEPGMYKALGSAGKNPLSSEAARIASQIANSRSMNYRELLTGNYHEMGRKNLDTVLDELRLMGRVKQDGMNFVWIGNS
jgi:hypothetical protein